MLHYRAIWHIGTNSRYPLANLFRRNKSADSGTYPLANLFRPEQIRGRNKSAVTPPTTGVPRHPYEGCTCCFIHEQAHTNARFLSCDGHQLYERGVDLEVEGVHYIEMHRGPAAYKLGPPPSRGRDLELEGGVNACHVEYVYESRDSPCEEPSNGVVEISLLPVCTVETSI